MLTNEQMIERIAANLKDKKELCVGVVCGECPLAVYKKTEVCDFFGLNTYTVATMTLNGSHDPDEEL